jgi:hypothetical protein
VPNPVFNLSPAATVDEGNNWINISWGPLAETNPVSGATLGNYAPASTSSVINYIRASATTNYNEAPSTDFFGNARKTNGAVDAGAVEFGAAAPRPAVATISPASALRGTTVAVTISGSGFSGGAAVRAPIGIAVSNVRVVNGTTLTATLTIARGATLGANGITVTANGLTSSAMPFTVLGPTLTSVTPNSSRPGRILSVTIHGTGLNGATGVAISGGGITCRMSSTPTATRVTAVCGIGPRVTLSAKAVTVNTPIGLAGGVTFDVTTSPASPPRVVNEPSPPRPAGAAAQ